MGLVLHADNRWRLLVLMTGMLFAQVRRTVVRWLRAARIKSDVSDGDDFVSAVGKHVDAVAGQRLTLRSGGAVRVERHAAEAVRAAGRGSGLTSQHQRISYAVPTIPTIGYWNLHWSRRRSCSTSRRELGQGSRRGILAGVVGGKEADVQKRLARCPTATRWLAALRQGDCT